MVRGRVVVDAVAEHDIEPEAVAASAVTLNTELRPEYVAVVDTDRRCERLWKRQPNAPLVSLIEVMEMACSIVVVTWLSRVSGFSACRYNTYYAKRDYKRNEGCRSLLYCSNLHSERIAFEHRFGDGP